MNDLGHQVAFQALRRGTDVISSDGVVVGAVKQVRWDGRTNIFDGIVVAPKAGGGNKFVDAPEVDAIHERGVLIAHAADEIQELPKPRHYRPLWMRRIGL